MSRRWRAVVAALLHPDTRAALAELSTAQMSDKRRRRAFDQLAAIGLVVADEDGGWRFDDGELRGLLAEDTPTVRIGVERFLTPSGRIDRYPQRDSDRAELLRWVVERAIDTDAVLSEPDVNARLEPFAPGGDVAVLRRYLVDHELLERTPTGSEYRRPSRTV